MGTHGKARALVVHELGGPFTVEEVELSDDLRKNEIIVRMVATGICHTDVASSQGIRPPHPPAVYGHEGAGVVEKVGTAIEHLQVGDHVVLTLNSCGRCRPCGRNLPSYCQHGFDLTFGGQRLDGTKTLSLNGTAIASPYFGQSSFASRSVVDASCAVKVDQSLPLDVLCSLACGIQTGAGTVLNILNPRVGSSVVVYGGGGAVGLAAVAVAAKCSPATQIIAVDLDESRLGLAAELGATHSLNSKGQDLVTLVRSVTGGLGADYSIDCTGSIPVIQAMLEAAAQNGICATVGTAPEGASISIEPSRWIGPGVSYVGSALGAALPSQLIPAMIEWWKQGRLPLERLITRYPWTSINQALDDMHTAKTIKPVLIWDSEA